MPDSIDSQSAKYAYEEALKLIEEAAQTKAEELSLFTYPWWNFRLKLAPVQRKKDKMSFANSTRRKRQTVQSDNAWPQAESFTDSFWAYTT